MTKCQDVGYHTPVSMPYAHLLLLPHILTGNKVSKERDERNNPQKLHERRRTPGNSSGIGGSNRISSY